MNQKTHPAKLRTAWRVGDLAKLTGLTVRTLHHYEAIGLLATPARTEGRQRLYDKASVRRLYRIRVLRELGVPLGDIRRLLEHGASVAAVLHQHLSHIEGQVDQLTALRDRLRRLCRQPQQRVDPDHLLQTLEAMSRVARHVDARRQGAAARSTRSQEPQWRALARELRSCLVAGDDPASVRARDVARRVRQRIHEFAGNDPAILQALGHLRTAAPPASLAGWDPPLMAYLDRALRAVERPETPDAR